MKTITTNPTPIDRLYQEYSEIIKSLTQKGELSLSISAEENLRKSLLLGVASYFEHTICIHVSEFVKENTKDTEIIAHLVQNKAISRQYHTWFTWKENNANSFFGLFGSDFKSKIVANVKSDETLNTAIKDFMEIGRERNNLVHTDYATFNLEKTLDEIFQKYLSALNFTNAIPRLLRTA